MDKQSALDIILEFYDAPQEELEHVYDLTIHLYKEATRSNLINGLKEHYKRLIKLNNQMLNICNDKPDFNMEKQRINQQNRLLAEQIRIL